MLNLYVSGGTKYLANMQIEMLVTGSSKIKARGGQYVAVSEINTQSTTP